MKFFVDVYLLKNTVYGAIFIVPTMNESGFILLFQNRQHTPVLISFKQKLEWFSLRSAHTSLGLVTWHNNREGSRIHKSPNPYRQLLFFPARLDTHHGLWNNKNYATPRYRGARKSPRGGHTEVQLNAHNSHHQRWWSNAHQLKRHLKLKHSDRSEAPLAERHSLRCDPLLSTKLPCKRLKLIWPK